ncbi:MAG: hypothetical protein AAB369_02885 [Chloroflexota bacterium]
MEVRRPDRSYCFEVWAGPACLWSRIPFIGPFFTFNNGYNPRFTVSIKYLGYKSSDVEARAFDDVSIPSLEDEVLWALDLGLMIDGKYVEGGDVMQVDFDLTTQRHKTQRYITREWPLTRSGSAELQVQYSPGETIYSFEVKDISHVVTTMIWGVVLAILGFIVGRWVRG